MKVKVNAVAPVFAWTWDTRDEDKILQDIEKRAYPYITNCHKPKVVEQPIHDIEMTGINNDELDLMVGPQNNSARIYNQETEIKEDGEDDEYGEDDEDTNDVCGICRVNYNGTCPTCKIPGDSCRLVIGECKHYFHYHCILKWLQTIHSKGLCPMCRRKFLLKSNYPINEASRRFFNSEMVDFISTRVNDDENIGDWVTGDYSDSDSSRDDVLRQYEDPILEYVSEEANVQLKRWPPSDGTFTWHESDFDSPLTKEDKALLSDDDDDDNNNDLVKKLSYVVDRVLSQERINTRRGRSRY